MTNKCIRIPTIKEIFLIISLWSLPSKTTSQLSPGTSNDTDNFKTLLLNSSNLYVDKTMLIQEYLQLINENIPAIIILRPEGWGKSTNLKMLEYFLKVEVDEKGHPLPEEKTINHKLFLGDDFSSTSNNHNTLNPLKISNFPKTLQHLGKHPVVLLQLKNATGKTYEQIEHGIKLCVMEVYKSTKYLVHSPRITEKSKFRNYLSGQINKKDLISSIYFLSEKLYEHFGQKVHILIDDYDIPFISAFINYCTADYRKVAKLLESIYEKTSKENPYQKVTLFTGVFPIKTNVQVYYKDEHLSHPPFSEFFGFNRDEVNELLKKSSIAINPEDVDAWYGGYYIGEKNNYYNSRSVIRLLNHKGILDYYGSSITTDPQAMEDWYPEKKADEKYNNCTKFAAFDRNSISIPAVMAERMFIEKNYDFYRIPKLFLINGHYIRSNDELEAHSFGNIRALDYSWSFENLLSRDMLFYSGYLTTNATGLRIGEITYFDLFIPNNETRYFYHAKTFQWLCYTLDIDVEEFHSLVDLLSKAEIPEFQKILQKCLCKPKVTEFFNSGPGLELYQGLVISLKYLLSPTHTTDYEYDGYIDRDYVTLDHLYFIEHEIIFIPKPGQSDTVIILRYEVQMQELFSNSIIANATLQRVDELRKHIKIQMFPHLGKIIKISLAFINEKMDVKFKIDNISS